MGQTYQLPNGKMVADSNNSAFLIVKKNYLFHFLLQQLDSVPHSTYICITFIVDADVCV